MILEKQVVSLELAKKLKELGVKQESLFYWHRSWNPEKKVENEPYVIYEPFNKSKDTDFSAFTVAELGEMLWNIFEKNGWKLIYKAYGDVFGFKGTSWIGELGIVNLMRDPDMSAKMLVYLLENKLITL